MTEQQIKAAVRARDGMRCVECGMSESEHYAIYGRNLDVHRVIPGSEYRLDGCQTLCRRCHGPKPRSPYRDFPDTMMLRLLDPRLATALEEYARRVRRSRNLAIVVILEEAMERAGLWPPSE